MCNQFYFTGFAYFSQLVCSILLQIVSKHVMNAVRNLLVCFSSFFQKIVTIVDAFNTFEFVI